MKHLLYLFLSLTLVITSCDKDDDDCSNPGSLSSVIVGEWDVTTLGIVAGEVEFRSDGTVIDNDETLVEQDSGDMLTYTVNDNDSFTITITKSGGTQENETIGVSSFDCNTIDIESGLAIITLKRE